MEVAAVLTTSRVMEALKIDGKFRHNHTFQGSALQAAAAVAVMKIVTKPSLLLNVQKKGEYLIEQLKHRLDGHPHVGDIRGIGLFCGIELVKNKLSKTPFDPSLNTASNIQELALSSPFNLMIYSGKGGVDGINGDHLILAPHYNISKKNVEHVAKTLSNVVYKYFNVS